MAEDVEDDVAKALEFLRKHDVSRTGVPTAPSGSIDIDELDLNDDTKVSNEPVGPNWKRPGSFAQLPKIAGHPDSDWMMHERQDSSGRYKPWLFFSKKTGEYYRINETGSGYLPMGTPHNPWASPITVRVGSASAVTDAGTKLDMTVLLPDLQKTGFLLKQPLEFLDKPASLFVLCAGLRKTALASEFCAKRFHTLVLPKLSSRATVWYDYELVDIVTEATKALDCMLLESSAGLAGCSLAVALLAGCRLVVASLGSVRCLLCRSGVPAGSQPQPSKPGSASAAPTPWVARPVFVQHTLTNKDEVARLELESGGVFRSSSSALRGESARPSAVAAVADEWERELLRVTSALNSFAALGVSPADIQEGSAAIRRIFRRRSLIVHPDKVLQERRQQTTAIFSRLEAAADAIDGMLQVNAAAAVLLAEIHTTHDEGRLAADPATAAKLLGAAEGCTAEEAAKAAKAKFETPLSKLQHAAREDVERAMKILDIAKATLSRGVQLWVPADADVGLTTTRALGCKDLKAPVALTSVKIEAEVVQLGLSETAGLALVTEGAEAVSDTRVAQVLSEHAPGRPRAAALRIALDAGQGGRPAVSAVCAFFAGELASGGGAPAPKRQKSGRPERVRVSHVLLRWAGLKYSDEFERPGIAPPTRTQAEAERQLLELAEALLRVNDPRSLGARFKAEVLQQSECSTALNVPHADLGWVEPGNAEASLEAAAFDTPIGGLSDVVVTSRGAHLMYRLA